jgi:hypothetical protein
MSDLMKGSKWYESMPLDIQIVYLENITDDQLEIVCNMYFESFSAFLSESFVWNDTPEGFEYWLEVSKFNFHEA